MTIVTGFPAVACVQFPIALGDVAQNLAFVQQLISDFAPMPGTLMLLPEMWATGFDYLRTREWTRQTPHLLAAMQRMATEHHITLAGTLAQAASTEELPTNTLFVVGPEGVVGSLAKQHLFRHWQEDRFFQAGPAGSLLHTPHGPLGGLVCYDLRFPEVARRQVFAGARLLLVAAQWPLSRLAHWQTLVQARAIENQVYVAATNGCGQTGTMAMAGHSMLVAPDGTVVRMAGGEATVIDCPFDDPAIDAARCHFCPAGDRPYTCPDQGKIKTLLELQAELDLIRRQGSRIAFTNGCFDILHAGHVSYLEAARRTADCLVVGLNTDGSVRGLKGSGRPMNCEADRARVLAALGCVDYVVLFAEPTPIELIVTLKPDVLVKGADYQEAQIVGATEVKAAGGQVVRIAFQYERSTSALIEKIQLQPAGAGLVPPTTASSGGKTMTRIYITGMKCQHCLATAKKALEDLGAKDVVIDLAKGTAQFEGTLDKQDIRRILAEKGFALSE